MNELSLELNEIKLVNRWKMREGKLNQRPEIYINVHTSER